MENKIPLKTVCVCVFLSKVRSPPAPKSATEHQITILQAEQGRVQTEFYFATCVLRNLIRECGHDQQCSKDDIRALKGKTVGRSSRGIIHNTPQFAESLKLGVRQVKL